MTSDPWSSPFILEEWCVSMRGARTWGATLEVLELSSLHLNLWIACTFDII